MRLQTLRHRATEPARKRPLEPFAAATTINSTPAASASGAEGSRPSTARGGSWRAGRRLPSPRGATMPLPSTSDVRRSGRARPRAGGRGRRRVRRSTRTRERRAPRGGTDGERRPERGGGRRVRLKGERSSTGSGIRNVAGECGSDQREQHGRTGGNAAPSRSGRATRRPERRGRGRRRPRRRSSARRLPDRGEDGGRGARALAALSARAGREPLQPARDEGPGCRVGEQEQHRRTHQPRERDEQNGAPADLVGDAACEQQRREDAEGVGRVDQRQRQGEKFQRTLYVR